MKELIECSLIELIVEKQLSIKNQNIKRYRECSELIDTISNNTGSKCLEDFKKQYPQITSGDLQTFVLGFEAARKMLEF